MTHTTLRAGTSVTVEDIELIPIEKTVVCGSQIGPALVVTAVKEPVAIVVRSPHGVWALDLDGGETSLAALAREVGWAADHFATRAAAQPRDQT